MKNKQQRSGNWLVPLRLYNESVLAKVPEVKECAENTAVLLKAECCSEKRVHSTKENNITLRAAIDNYIAARDNT